MWSHPKRSLANLPKRGIDQLTGLIKTRLKKTQYRPGLLNSYLAQTALALTPPQPPPLMISSRNELCGTQATTHPTNAEILPSLSAEQDLVMFLESYPRTLVSWSERD
ncbi:hypothetical protein GCM10010349_79400 [Streptomyces flavofungini]|nr:hypothetical protein GCM10010349_79400 [Streptomyces flavofungini]